MVLPSWLPVGLDPGDVAGVSLSTLRRRAVSTPCHVPLGGMLYILIMALIFYRFLFFA